MKKISFINSFRRLFRFYEPDVYDFIVIFTYSCINGILLLVVPIAASSLVTTIAFGQLFQPLIVLGFFVLIGLLGVAIFRFMQVRLVEIIQQRIFARVAVTLAKRLPNIEYSFWRNRYAPELVNRFLEIVTIQKITAQILMEGAGVLFQVVISLLLISFYHPLLLLFSLILTLVIIAIFLLGFGATSTSYQESNSKYELLHWFEEMARFPVLFKSNWGQSLALKRADSLVVNYLNCRKAHFKILARHFLSSYILNAIAASAILVLGGWLVMINQLTLGQLVAAEIVVSATLYSVSKFGKTLESLYDVLASVAKLDELLSLPFENHIGKIKLKENGAIAVKLQNTILPLAKSQRLKINLELAPGAKVAILGRNGSGKSTIANLLYKLIKPAGGLIKIDDIDVRDIEVDSLRGRVHLVRGFDILEGTVEENVTCLREEISLEAVINALRQVGLLKVVETFENGIQTKLSSSGAPFSSGQVAQLILARAIVGNPGLIILDETLDTIDPLSLKKFYEVLLAPDAPWTLIDLTSDPVVWDGFEKHYQLSNKGLELIETSISKSQE